MFLILHRAKATHLLLTLFYFIFLLLRNFCSIYKKVSFRIARIVAIARRKPRTLFFSLYILTYAHILIYSYTLHHTLCRRVFSAFCRFLNEYVCLYIYVCMYVYMYVCMYICIYVCIYIFLHVCCFIMRNKAARNLDSDFGRENIIGNAFSLPFLLQLCYVFAYEMSNFF
jgi:hypothetical protein